MATYACDQIDQARTDLNTASKQLNAFNATLTWLTGGDLAVEDWLDESIIDTGWPAGSSA